MMCSRCFVRLTLPWKWESLSDDSSTLRVKEVALLEMEGVCGDYIYLEMAISMLQVLPMPLTSSREGGQGVFEGSLRTLVPYI